LQRCEDLLYITAGGDIEAFLVIIITLHHFEEKELE